MTRISGLLIYGLAAFPLTLIGRGRRAAELRERRIGNGPARTRGSIGALLPSLLAFVAALLVVYLVWAGWLYPVRPDVIEHLSHPFTKTPDLDGAWGGPTLVGAWLVHALIAVGLQLVALAVIRGVAALNP
jgi:ABC-type antimicrobial peptide transport system permease subunit